MGLGAYLRAWADRRTLRRARPARGFARDPEPRALGSYANGRLIVQGRLPLTGRLIETQDPWTLEASDPALVAALHGWDWLDDLAAYGDAAARDLARRWLDDWIARFGLGQGPGWAPQLAGRRLTRWLQHGLFLTAEAEPEATARTLAALGRHAAWLARTHDRAPSGLPRIEAQSAWLQAALMLRGIEGHAPPALSALTDSADALIGPDGGIPARNPAELLAVMAQLAWCRTLLADAGQPLPDPLLAALRRGAGALRALTQADGSLARFHGGGAGPEGLLERTLAEAAPEIRARPLRAMGFARMEGGRTTVITDAAPPPAAGAPLTAQASTLAFQLTSGRRPVVVSSGPGAGFGPDWDRGARATAAHATLGLDGVSSARFATVPGAAPGSPPALIDGPREVPMHRSDLRDGSEILLAHDGWVATHGLTHSRALALTADGRTLLGSDDLSALSAEDQARFRQVRQGLQGRGLGFALRFPLHPDTEARLDAQGQAVTVTLPSGEVWGFRFDIVAGDRMQLGLEPAVWLEPGRRAPVPSQQIVLRGTLSRATARINWTLAKAEDTPLAIRDIGRAQEMDVPAGYLDRD